VAKFQLTYQVRDTRWVNDSDGSANATAGPTFTKVESFNDEETALRRVGVILMVLGAVDNTVKVEVID